MQIAAAIILFILLTILGIALQKKKVDSATLQDWANIVTIASTVSALIVALLFGIFYLLPPNSPAEPEISGEVTLWYAYLPGSSEEIALKTVVSNVEKQFTDLSITTEYVPYDEIVSTYENEVEAGGGPDMFIMPNDGLGQLARNGSILPLDAYLEGNLDQVYQSAIDAMKVNGKIYGVPESSKVLALFYNKGMVHVPPATTAELRQMVQNQNSFAAPIYSYDLFGFSGAFGGELFDNDNKCIADQGGWVDALQYLVDLQNAGAQFVGSREQLDELFTTGQVAMVINGPWALVNYKAYLGDQLGVGPIPAGPAGPANPILGIDGIYVNPNTPNAAITAQVALQLTNQQSSQIFTNLGGHIPVRKDVTSNDPLIDYFRQAEMTAMVRPQNEELTNYWMPFYDMFLDVLDGSIAPGDGVARACSLMNQANGK